jgi:cell volume regulation protein A
MLGGSGFLAVYLAGIVLGSRRIVFQRGIFVFSDGLAWLGQIVMFVVLGLLSFPSRLIDVAGAGLAISAVLIFIARPAAVALLVPWFGFNIREVAFIAWVGLKGAVPIVLAIFPLLFGFDDAILLFNVVFFVVLVSALTQGWTLPLLARRLGLEQPAEPEPAVSLEITSLRHVDGDIVEYAVGPDARPAGRRISELALPDGAVIALIARGQELIPPRGSTRIAAEDHVFLVLRPGLRSLVDRVFARDPGAVAEPLPALEFPLLASTTAGDLEEFYGIRIDVPPDRTLGQILADALGEELSVGGEFTVGDVVLRVRAMDDREIEQVGLVIRSDTA